MKILFFLVIGIIFSHGQEFSEISNLFTADVYRELTKSKTGNFIVSPVSAHIVLSLAFVGAKGNTAKQLSTGLHLPDDVGKVQDIILKLASQVIVNKTYTFTTANKIYISNKYDLVEEYQKTAVDVFHSGVDGVDFSKTKQVVDGINKWVETKTSDKIKNLIKEEHIDPNTFAILVNALYFKGNWSDSFSPHHTSLRKFHLDKNNQVDVAMMWMKGFQNYYENKDLKATFLELSFSGGDVTMTFVLPNDKEGLAALETRISDIISRPPYKRENLVLILPKFKMETDIEFNDILQNLGVVDAFTATADFSGISKTGPPVRVSEVVQKAFLEINEQGATAAASTDLGLVPLSGIRKQFVADHPFIFYLTHKNTGVFFIGRFMTPPN